MESTVQIKIPMTKEEELAINKFQDLLKAKKVEYDPSKFDNSYLIRFLRARKLDMNKTLEMFTNFLKWRKENNIDDIEKYQFPEIDKIKVFYPHGFHKTDLQGRPIYIEILGELKVDDMFKVTTPDRLLTYQVREYERLLKNIFPQCTKAANNYISQTFTIFDLKKLTSKLLTKKVYNFIKLTSHNSQNYYPEILGQLYIVNSGLLFKAAWAVCKGFLDEKTRKKIVILGSDFKKKLFQHVSADNLPKFLGGECICEPYGCIVSNPGPWNKDGIVEISPELMQAQQKLMNSNANDDTADQNIENNEGLNFEEEEKEKLEELSQQLDEQMTLSKGQGETIKFKLENQINDGETPINTQEGNESD